MLLFLLRLLLLLLLLLTLLTLLLLLLLTRGQSMQFGADDSEADSAAAVAAFSQVVAYCVTETCRRALVLGHFGEALPQGSCTGCDCCEQPDVVKAQV